MTMKQTILTTTALAGVVGIMTASNALAEGLDLSIGGEINFQAGFSDQDSPFDTTGAFTRDVKFANDTEIHFNVSGEADNGLKYGAVIDLEADVSADNRGEGTNADKTFIWLESDLGRVELGNNEGAEAAMAVNAATIARATGGIDGDDEFYINSGGVAPGATFLIHPDLPTADTGGATEDATKITYYSPSFSGIQLGVSYTPDEGDGGTAAGFTGELNGDQENVFGLGLNYAGTLESVDVNVGLVGAFGQSELATTEDLAAWQLGTALTFEGFSLAGSYGDWDDSTMAVGSNLDTSFWTLGAAYENGPMGVSVTYLDSERGNDDFTNLVVGADYALAPGLTPYVEVSFFDADQSGTATDNDGTVVLVGTYLSF
ncbi:MAG: porin [Hyphomicrobiales bacterium]|nr:porin [Hyphomicrobiales bacterium]